MVINHTLLFMLLGSPEEQEERDEGYLFPNDFIIFDEAHTIEQVASRADRDRDFAIRIARDHPAALQRPLKKGLFTVTRDAAGVTLAASLVDEADRFSLRSRNGRTSRKKDANIACGKRILSTIRSPDAWLRSRGASAKWSASPRTSSSKRSCRNWDGALAMRAKGSRSSCNRAPRVRLLDRAHGKGGPEYHAQRRADRCRAGPAADAFPR